MKKILIHIPGSEQDTLFDAAARDGCHDPFIYLRDRLRVLGYQLVSGSIRSTEGCARVLFVDAVGMAGPPRSWRIVARSATNSLFGRRQLLERWQIYEKYIRVGWRDRLVLFLWEAPAFCPQNSDPKVHEQFPVVFTWNDNYVDGKTFHKFLLPTTGRFPEVPDVPFHRRKLLVNITCNKTVSHPRELYSARREAIRYFEQHDPEDWDLYGVGWNQSGTERDFFPSYRGTVSHKWDVFPQYRFGLCYENIRDEPGYITEKIFDCMRAGCVPIYWGASNVERYVDRGAFIDRREFKSNVDLGDFLLSMSEHEWTQYRAAIKTYLRSARFAAFLPEAFADNIIQVLTLSG